MKSWNAANRIVTAALPYGLDAIHFADSRTSPHQVWRFSGNTGHPQATLLYTLVECKLRFALLLLPLLPRDLPGPFGEFAKSGGMSNGTVAMRYRREILEKGGSEDAEDMVAAFLGRRYSSKAFEEWISAGVA